MAETPTLTPAQARAIESHSHAVLIANAGSGKTFTLVAHYIHLLENEDIAAEQIAAITFTDNAAAELREKITTNIFKRIQALSDISADQIYIDRLWKALQQIDVAPISTIHGFCSRLLREHPIEAGIDPAFGILQGVERSLLIEESIDAVLHRRLRELYDDPSSDTDGLLATFNLFGRSKIHGWIRQLLDRRFAAAKAIETLRGSDDLQLDAAATKAFDSHVAGVVANGQVRTALSKLSTLFASTKDAKVVSDLYDLYVRSLGKPEYLGNLSAFLEGILTQKDEPRSRVFKDSGKGGVNNVEEAAALLGEELRPLVELRQALTDAVEWNTSAPHSFAHLRNVFRLYEQGFEEYAQGKIAQGLLDHDDLIDYGVRLLGKPEVAAEIASTLRYCFVDEYQDTDDRQYNLLRSITQEFTNHVRVTIVGDPKQSIYRFRDADLDVFHRTVDTLVRASNEPAIKLDVCFRMLPFPLTLANTVTDHIFGLDPLLRERYFYTPLVTARPEEGTGSVTMLIAQRGSSSTEEETETSKALIEEGLSEEELIARAILEKKATDDGAHFADMAILLRDRKRLSELEITLRHHSIPYSLSSGLGFYQQQEIIDALTLLHVLIDPSDDLYLVALLRSPYIELDDRTLWNVMHQRNAMKPRPSLWDFLHDLRAPLTSAQLSRLNWLEQLLPFTGRTDTVTLLERAITETQIELTYYSFSDGAQKVSNLRKLVALAGRSDLPVWEFVEQCRILQEHDDREQQAVQPTDDAVRIMTIHASKGLEFPIVFLPFLGDAGRKRPSNSILTRHFPHVLLESHETAEPIRHPYSRLAAIREKEEEQEEELRILYVALTRAKNETYLSATVDPAKTLPEQSQFSRILRALDLDLGRMLTADTVTLQHPLSRFSLGTVDTDLFCGEIAIRRSIDITEVAVYAVTTDVPATFRLQDIPPERGVTRYSPTQLLTYYDCPTKYVLRYNLGFPELHGELAEYDATEDRNATSASVYGTLLHAAFEGIGDAARTYELTDERFAALAFATGVPKQQEDAYRQRLSEELARALASPLFASIIAAEANYTEIPLRFALEEHYVLSGILDRLFRDEDGVWNVVDYKTTRQHDAERSERYTFQTKLYAFLVFKLFDCPTVATHLYFTATGQTVSKTYSDIDLAGFEDELKQTIGAIMTGREARSLSAIEKNRSHCPECPYSTDHVQVCVLDPTSPVSLS